VTTISRVEGPKDVGDRQLDALLERIDALTAELRALNRRLESGENLAPVVRELALLNEALAYASLGQQGPQVRRRRAG
jgi:Ni,Fe-hydrogenase III large subunit